MGRKDHATKEYMKDDARFADAFNYLMYEGKKIIVPERLEEQDAAELLSFYDAEERLVSKQEFRDVLKRSVLMHDEDAYYLLLGIENQSEVNYAMPVRNYVYDAMNYAEQVAGIAKKHRKDKDVKGAEFLSGFKRTDKLIPVITLVILWNSGGWDGPRNLHEMLAVRDETILKFVPNYHLNLIVPEEVKDFGRFQTELKLVMEFLAAKNDGKKMRELMEREHEHYSDIDIDSAKVLEACTDVHFYNENSEEGGVNMCRGIEEMMEEAAREAVEKEREKMCRGIEEMKEEAAREAVEKERERMCRGIEEMKEEAAREAVEKEREKMCRGIEEMMEEAAREAVEKEREKMCRGIEEMKEEAAREAVEKERERISETIEKEREKISETIEKEREKISKEIASELRAAGMELETICNIVKCPMEIVQTWITSAEA